MLGEEAEVPASTAFKLLECSTYPVPDGRRQRVILVKNGGGQ